MRVQEDTDILVMTANGKFGFQKASYYARIIRTPVNRNFISLCPVAARFATRMAGRKLDRAMRFSSGRVKAINSQTQATTILFTT